MFLLVVAVTAAVAVLAWLAEASRTPMAYVGVFVFVIAGWIVSLCFHEFGHAFTAWRYGDHDVAVRAIGADGEVQTDRIADVLPDGATGYHTVRVSAY